MVFVRVKVVHPYSCTDTDITWKKSSFILSERSDFYMVDNLMIAIHVFSMRMLTSLLVDEILLPRYVNWLINFRGLPLKMNMDPSYLKFMNIVLFVFSLRPILHAARFLWNRGSAWMCLRDALDHLYSLHLSCFVWLVFWGEGMSSAYCLF